MIEFLRQRCQPNFDDSHQARISGPLLDRISMQLEVAALEPMTLAKESAGETSSAIAARVARARARQLERQQHANQHMGTHELDRYCRLNGKAESLLRDTMLKLHWSARAYHGVLKVARTIADLAGVESLSAEHVGEAIQYRRGLRGN